MDEWNLKKRIWRNLYVKMNVATQESGVVKAKPEIDGIWLDG